MHETYVKLNSKLKLKYFLKTKKFKTKKPNNGDKRLNLIRFTDEICEKTFYS